MTTTSPGLTPKQKKVLELMEKGVAPAEIAKRLKISASGVYAHKRNIEQILGRPVPTVANGTTTTATVPTPAALVEPPPAATTIGRGDQWRPAGENTADPVDVLRLAVERDKTRAEQIATEIAELTAEQEGIAARLGKYTAALEALA